MNGGLISDEFIQATGGMGAPDDRILPDGGPMSIQGLSYPGSRTRINALQAIELLQKFAPTPSARIGELFAAVGTIETTMAEDMCSGVPLATLVNGEPVPGPRSTTATLYAHALAQFDSADRYAGDSARITAFAAVGRARALLDLDSVSAAARAASAATTGYRYQALYAISTQPNPVTQNGFQFHNMAVSNREGLNGLPFVSASDPRVPIDSSNGLGQDGVTPLYVFVPFGDLSAPITVASGIEARLIEAESALRAGDVAGWAARLNALRADAAETGTSGLPPLTADSTTLAPPQMRIDVMFRERAFWLFATGHRQGDLRRLIRQYGRRADQVFPTGLYKNNGTQYGGDITFPVTGENVNSTAPECLDRNP